MKKIEVATAPQYQVVVGTDLLAHTGDYVKQLSHVSRVFIVTDEHVAPLYLQTVKDSLDPTLPVSELILPAGESTKSAEQWMQLLSAFCNAKLTRTDLVIALGGGVIGDLTGFAASCYLRGIRYLQIPTTLLAQVDSSVGGKTAINIPEGKNLVGCFYQPCLVLCDIDTLNTLSKEDFSSGMAEVIKYGCIWDESLLAQLQQMDDPETRIAVITRCIEIKASVVSQDERDTGLRMILNFGHTLGHAVEKHHGFGGYTHGQAVAIGMVTITRLAEHAGLTASGSADRIEQICKQFDLPTVCDVPTDTLLSVCGLDKKNTGKLFRIILLDHIGCCRVVSLPPEGFRAFLEGSPWTYQ